MSEEVPGNAAQAGGHGQVPVSHDLLRSLRHELRTPLNHILGYCELLIEEAEAEGPYAVIPDLQRIHAAGRSLLELISDFLDPAKGGSDRLDVDNISYELRTPLNTIIGYSDLLQAEVTELGGERLIPDLQRIHTAGTQLLSAIEAALDLIRVQIGQAQDAPSSAAAVAAREATTSTRVAATQHLQPHHAAGRILVVDDDAMNRDVLSRRLGRLGYTVAVAEQGRQALEMVRTEPFDLLLLDIIMPEMNGFEVLEHLKRDQVLRELPVIVLSALDEVDDAVRCIEMGADDYLTKPVNSVLLLARVDACLEKKHLRDQEVDYLRQAAQVTGAAAIAQLLCGKYRFAPPGTPAGSPPESVDASPEALALRDIEIEVEWVSLGKGDILFRRGDPSEAVYIVIHGRLGIAADHAQGDQQAAGEMGRGEIIGEPEMVTGQVHPATVYAIRDSGLARISRAGFDRLAQKHPRVLTHTTRDVMGRLRQAFQPKGRDHTVSTFALVPLGADVPLSEFARDLAAALANYGSTLYLDRARLGTLTGQDTSVRSDDQDVGSNRLVAWLNELEMQYRFVIYEADPTASPWTFRCMRQADRILLVGRAEPAAAPGAIEATLVDRARVPPETRRELILLHKDRHRRIHGTQAWLTGRSVAAHHHVCPQAPLDIQRLARRLAGRALGLVLGGGGARGYAHIGVIRALEEAGFYPDVVGGTSMGALIAGYYARGMDPDAITEVSAKFGPPRQLFDYTFPVVSFFAGRKLMRMLLALFEEIHIEDLWLPFFCVSSNLTRAKPVVHRQGPLWQAVRASLSIPGVFPPLPVNGDLLVDGGIMNNFPVDLMREMAEGGLVIASSVVPEHDLATGYTLGPSISGWQVLWSRLNPFGQALKVPSILETLSRSREINDAHQRQLKRSLADLFISSPVGRFPVLDFRPVEQIAEVGYQSARKAIAEWQTTAGLHWLAVPAARLAGDTGVVDAREGTLS